MQNFQRTTPWTDFEMYEVNGVRCVYSLDPSGNLDASELNRIQLPGGECYTHGTLKALGYAVKEPTLPREFPGF